MNNVIDFEERLKFKWLEDTGYVKINMFEDEAPQYAFRCYYGDYGAQNLLSHIEVVSTSLHILKLQHKDFMHKVTMDVSKL